MLDDLISLSRKFLSLKNNKYRRYLISSTNFNKSRISLILGQRGVGKTTTLVQSLLDNVDQDIFSNKILYIQADHFQMGNKTLYEIAEEFLALGGKWIAFDEIHKYSKWSKELKSIYDTFPQLQVIASGSSALEIHKGSHDLSRRVIKYYMYGMSFREYLGLVYDIHLPFYDLDTIIENHEKITFEIINSINKKDLKIIPLFKKYLRYGYYPYIQELKDENLYQITLEQNIHTTIESDLASIFPKLSNNSLKKMKELLIFISDSVPFIPNWSKILQILDIGDIRTLKSYFKHLEDAGLIKSICNSSSKLKKLEIEEKIYLQNPNQLYAISSSKDSEIGTVRETFFISMMSLNHQISLPKKGGFIINKKYVFEVGGKNKNFEQLKDIKNSFVAIDDIEIGVKRKIPLWLIGFLY